MTEEERRKLRERIRTAAEAYENTVRSDPPPDGQTENQVTCVELQRRYYQKILEKQPWSLQEAYDTGQESRVETGDNTSIIGEVG